MTTDECITKLEAEIAALRAQVQEQFAGSDGAD
jgi:hypothetical protein